MGLDTILLFWNSFLEGFSGRNRRLIVWRTVQAEAELVSEKILKIDLNLEIFYWILEYLEKF